MAGPDTAGEGTAAPSSQALDALEAQAVALDAAASPPAPGAPGQAEPVPALDTAAELLGVLELLRMMAGPAMTWWPDFGQVWSDAQIRQIAQAGGAVIDRHGWAVGGLMSTWGPYLGLAAATLPPAAATYAAMRQHRAEQAARRWVEEAELPDQPEDAEGVRP
ncbi:hypothetical protein [Sphaerotilus mobilis]|uniref:Uncharacterized protein n=1 Tax=Sphaerotilus mobilis TaxID=47994 RepID=A0A4Q7LPP9_9BURK|nr:hypothetical protein [Sphaerotilus mobilis]RZS56716.1 hypothetical protein EV685_1270 [Sphaerotilus mobilis]